MKFYIAVATLNNAVAHRATEGADVAGCVLHTDRGSQFGARKLVHQLDRHQMVARWDVSAPPGTTPGWSSSEVGLLVAPDGRP